MNANTATPMPQKSRLSNFFGGFWVLAISDLPNALHAQARCPCDSANKAQRPINGYQVTLVPTSQRGLGERPGPGSINMSDETLAPDPDRSLREIVAIGPFLREQQCQ
jgi:hypothetical protein